MGRVSHCGKMQRSNEDNWRQYYSYQNCIDPLSEYLLAWPGLDRWSSQRENHMGKIEISTENQA